MPIKLNKKRIFYSVLTFIVCTAGLALLVLIMAFVNVKGNVGDFVDYVKNSGQNLIITGVALAVLSVITYCYMLFESPSTLARVSKTVELFLIFYIALIMCYILGRYMDAAARPLTFLALMTVTLFRRRDAIFLNTVFAIMLLMIDRFSHNLDITNENMIETYANLLCTFCSGIIAIFFFRHIKNRVECILLTIVLFIPVEIINFVIEIANPALVWSVKGFLNLLMYGALNCVFSTMLYMFFLPVFEIVFSELTVFRLRELTSDDAKLIRRLKNNAPGTYNHSVVVAQIVEACAREIGENAELARAAAYYHDVGKLKNPEMFAENQTDYNLHAELTPELSVDIIRSHTRDGAALIRKNHLPDFFADVAVQHHGSMPIKYFYVKALKMSDGELNIGNYSYAGPTPASKIAALIMIADASEAATRSLTDRSPENVEKLVRSLIEERLDMDQFSDCNITMKELAIVKRTIVNQLTGVYHSRVSYPKLKLSRKS